MGLLKACFMWDPIVSNFQSLRHIGILSENKSAFKKEIDGILIQFQPITQNQLLLILCIFAEKIMIQTIKLVNHK